jgi:hypothetical protein
MTLRLVLVSLVAALGLTIPGGPVIEEWVAATQNWMNARFADWDTRNPQEADFVVLNEYYGTEPGSALPRVSLPSLHGATSANPVESVGTAKPLANAPNLTAATKAKVRPVSLVRKLIVFEPIVVGESEPSDIAHVLNRQNQGIGIKPPAIRRKPATPKFERLALADDLYPGIAFELNRKNEGISIKTSPASHPAVAKAPSPSAPTTVFAGMEASESLYFTSPPDLPHSVTEKLANSVHKDSAPVVSADSSADSSSFADWGILELYQDSHSAPLVEPEVGKSVKARSIASVWRTVSTDPIALEGCDDLWLETAGALTDDIDGFAEAGGTLTAEGKSRTFSYGGTELGEELFDELVEGMIEDKSESATPARANPAIVGSSGSMMVVKSKPSFAPIEVADDLYVGVAYELNLRGERAEQPGITIASVKLPPSNVTPSVRELGRAVKLTREALSAWFNVFTGPAIVTASK